MSKFDRAECWRMIDKARSESRAYSPGGLLDAVDALQSALLVIDQMTSVVESFHDAVTRAAQAHQARGAGGQQVPFHDDFASATPSVMVSLQRWARDLRASYGEAP